MFYLLLAIVSSAFVSVAMRISTGRVKNNMTMFLSNYAVCMVLSGLFGLQGNLPSSLEGIWFPVGIGVVSGILYLGSFMLLQTNIRRNGVVLSATFMKLGVIVPVLMAVVFFHETPGIAAIAGIALALVAIVLINQNPEGESRGNSGQFGLLLILLVAGGFTDSMSSVYEKCGDADLKDLYLLCTFTAAFLFSAVMMICKKQRLTWIDLGWGALIGVPNYFSCRFLLLALSQVPATIAFPVFNIGIIVLVTVAGVVFFREKLSRRSWAAMGLIALALILLNI